MTVGSSCADTSVGEVVSSGFCASALIGVKITAMMSRHVSHRTNFFMIHHPLLAELMSDLLAVVLIGYLFWRLELS